ncbi:TPA: hypothetical protein ACKP22_004780 [Pseudomonas putida]
MSLLLHGRHSYKRAIVADLWALCCLSRPLRGQVAAANRPKSARSGDFESALFSVEIPRTLEQQSCASHGEKDGPDQTVEQQVFVLAQFRTTRYRCAHENQIHEHSEPDRPEQPVGSYRENAYEDNCKNVSHDYPELNGQHQADGL